VKIDKPSIYIGNQSDPAAAQALRYGCPDVDNTMENSPFFLVISIIVAIFTYSSYKFVFTVSVGLALISGIVVLVLSEPIKRSRRRNFKRCLKRGSLIELPESITRLLWEKCDHKLLTPAELSRFFPQLKDLSEKVRWAENRRTSAENRQRVAAHVHSQVMEIARWLQGEEAAKMAAEAERRRFSDETHNQTVKMLLDAEGVPSLPPPKKRWGR
jgi:hypothetical protein